MSIKTVSLETAKRDLSTIVDSVHSSGKPVVITDKHGIAVKLVPVETPSRAWRGRCAYTAHDRLMRRTPFPNEPKWE